MVLPKTGFMPRDGARVEDPAVVERDRAPARADLPPGVLGARRRCTTSSGAQAEIRAGRTKSWNDFKVPDEAISVGFHEAARGVLSHHMVIRDGKIANYQPYPPTPWNGNPRDTYGTPGPLRGRGAEHADLRGERARELQGRRHHAGGPLASTRACPAACTCTARARSARWCTPRPGCARWRPSSGAPRRSWSAASRSSPPRPRRSPTRTRGTSPTSWRPPWSSSTARASSGSSRRSSRGAARELAAGRGRGQPHAHPRPLPGRARGRACRRRSTRCGPTWSPTAATSSCSAIEDGIARLRLQGSLQRLRRRRRRRWSWRSRRRCRRRRPTCSASTSRASSRAPPRGRARRPTRSGSSSTASGSTRPWRGGAAALAPTRRRGLVVANVAGTLLAYRDRCAGCGAPLPRAMLLGGTLTCAAAARRFDLPRAGRCARRRRRCSSSRCRCCARRRRWRRRAGRARWPRRRRSTSARPERRHVRAVPVGHRRGPPPPAAPRRAAHRLRLRDVLVAALGRPGVPPAGRRGRCGSRTSRCPTRCGPRSRSRSAWRSCCAASVSGGGRRPVPEPGGRDGVRARRSTAWDALCAANPVLERLEPDAEALIVNRTGARARSTRSSPIDQAYRLVGLIKARWEGITGGRGVEDAVAEFFDGLRARRSRRERRRAGRRRRRPATEPVFSVLGVEPVAHAATPTLRFHAARRRPARARDPHDRALDADPDRPGAARLRRRDPASGSSSCSARPSAGRRRRRSSAGRTSSALVPGFTGATSFALDVPCTYDLEVAASKYFYSLPDGEVPLSFLFNGMVLYSGEDDRLQVAQVPWSCTARWRDAGRRLEARDGRLLPRRRLGAAATRRRSTRSPRARPRGGHHSFDALIAELLAMSRARRARRHAAVGGPRALPVHAGRDEERDADAVRDRLPARLRRGQPAHVRPAAAAVHRDGADGVHGDACTSCERRRGAARGSSCDERRATTDVRLRRRCAGARGWRPRTSAALVRVTVARGEHDRGRRRASTRDRGAGVLAALDARRRALRDRRALHVPHRAARGRRRPR